MWVWFHKLGSPRYFWRLSDILLPWITVLTLVAFTVGLLWGLIYSPPDYQQMETVRIMYVHVPAAILSLMVYVMMAVCGAVLLIWRMKMAEIVAYAAAPIGATFTFLALATGAIWGKPMWGTWWTWEARLTSELVLFFFYMGYIALYNAIEDKRKAGRAVALLALTTVVIVPIVKFSVEWWYTLHQGSTTEGVQVASTVNPAMRWPLFAMLISFVLFFTWVLFKRIRHGLLNYERQSSWVKELGPAKSSLWAGILGILVITGVLAMTIQNHLATPFYTPSQVAENRETIQGLFVSGEAIQEKSVQHDETSKTYRFNLVEAETVIPVVYTYKGKRPRWLHDRQRIRVEGTLETDGSITATYVHVNYYRYVWSVYLIALLLVIGNIVSAWRKEKQIRAEIQQMAQHEQKS